MIVKSQGPFLKGGFFPSLKITKSLLGESTGAPITGRSGGSGAHIFLFCMALQVERAMNMRLRRTASPRSPEKALYKLSIIHALKTGKSVGLTTLKEKHREVYKQLELPFPQVNQLAGSSP